VVLCQTCMHAAMQDDEMVAAQVLVRLLEVGSISLGGSGERERERGSDRSQRKGREQINKPNRIEKVSVGKKGVLWTFLSEHDLEEERSGGI